MEIELGDVEVGEWIDEYRGGNAKFVSRACVARERARRERRVGMCMSRGS